MSINNESIQNIIMYCESIDYYLVKQKLEDYFEYLESNPDQFKRDLSKFSDIMYNKYDRYAKTHVNRYIDDLSKNGFNDFSEILSLISEEMHTWEFVSDKKMFDYITNIIMNPSKFTAIKQDIDIQSFIKHLFIVEKLNRIYHLTREIFLPEYKKIIH